MPAKTSNTCDCWMGHIVIIGRLVSHFLQNRSLEEEGLEKEIAFSHLPLCSAEGASKGHLGLGEGGGN